METRIVVSSRVDIFFSLELNYILFQRVFHRPHFPHVPISAIFLGAERPLKQAETNRKTIRNKIKTVMNRLLRWSFRREILSVKCQVLGLDSILFAQSFRSIWYYNLWFSLKPKSRYFDTFFWHSYSPSAPVISYLWWEKITYTCIFKNA